jgi:uncharacterized protein (TIGR02266 family)
LVQLRLGYPDVDAFVSRFARNVTRGGVFIATRETRQVGDELRFEIALAGGPVVLAGRGRVTWVRPHDAEAPRKPYGMGIQFIEVDAATRPVLERLLEVREASGRVQAPGPERPRTGTATPAERTRKPSQPDDGEFDSGVSEIAIQRALEYARGLRGNLEQELADLLGDRSPADEPVTLEKAMSELQTMLRPRRASGLYRMPAPAPRGETPPSDGEK